MRRRLISSNRRWLPLLCLAVLHLCNTALAADESTLEQLKTRFDKEKGMPRLILLMSPT